MPERGHRVDQLSHRVGGAVQVGALLLGQVDLDDLLDTVLAELHRYTDEQPVDPVLALTQAAQGSTRFWSYTIESIISATAAAGA